MESKGITTCGVKKEIQKPLGVWLPIKLVANYKLENPSILKPESIMEMVLDGTGWY